MASSPGGGGAGRHSTDAWVGKVRPGHSNPDPVRTQFSESPIPSKTEFKIFIPYLRHLTQNHTLFKTRIK